MYQSYIDILWTKTLGACGMSLLLTELKAFSNLSFQPSVCWPEESTLCPSRDISSVLQPACLTYSDPPTFPSQLHHPSYHESSDIKLPLRFCLNIPVPYKLVFDPHPQGFFKNFLKNKHFLKYPFPLCPYDIWILSDCLTFCFVLMVFCTYLSSCLEVLPFCQG